MKAIVGVGVLLCGLIGAETAQARVQIDVDLSSQTMHVSGNGADYDWPVSTARAGYATPRGHYHAGHLERMHYSHKYHMSPMPYSIFFAGGYAIHGTYSTADLGRPASHGCIRLSPGHAEILYGMVQGQGANINITGSAPRSTPFSSHRRHRSVRSGDEPRAEPVFGQWRQSWPEAAPEPSAYAPARRAPYSARTPRMTDPLMRSDGWSQ
jgi:hypothetical protein